MTRFGWLTLLIAAMFCASRIFGSPVHGEGAVSESSYIVDKVGNFWVAQNGTTGNIDFNYTDPTATVQSCIYNLTSNISGGNAGKITLKRAMTFTKQIIIPRPNIILEGEDWRGTGISANFSGDIIQIVSGNETPSHSHTHCVRIDNLLFYNNNSSLNQCAIYINRSIDRQLWPFPSRPLEAFP